MIHVAFRVQALPLIPVPLLVAVQAWRISLVRLILCPAIDNHIMYFHRFNSSFERTSASAWTSAWKSKLPALSREGKHSMYSYSLAHLILMCCPGRRRSWLPIRHRSRSGRFPDNFNWRSAITWWKSARVRKDVNVIGTAS
jgi:hypothetical protein